MQAWRLWEDTAIEDALGQLFSPWLQRVKRGSDLQYGIVAVVIDDAQRSALQRLQCLHLRGSETWVPHWAGVLQDWPDHGAIKTQQVVPPGAWTFQLLKVQSRGCLRCDGVDMLRPRDMHSQQLDYLGIVHKQPCRQFMQMTDTLYDLQLQALRR